MPLRHPPVDPARGQARGVGVTEAAMTQLTALPRRDLLKAAGALIVAVALPAAPTGVRAQGAAALGSVVKPPLRPDQLDSWIAIGADGKVTAFFGKMDMGQGVDVAIGQIVAEELDVPFDRVTVVMGDTASSVNQGGASGSTGIQKGGVPLRNAAAEARRLLVEAAAHKLGVPVDRLDVVDGVVGVSGDATKRVSYAELIGGRYFDQRMEWNGTTGNDMVAKGQAKPKRPDQYKIVGQPIPRSDVAPKVFGQLDYVTDVKVPGMAHGRMIRPPVAGALPTAVDEGSIKDIPNVRVVWEKGLLAVVADKEWHAVRAAERLKVAWSAPPPAFPEQARLYDHIRAAPVTRRAVEVDVGALDPAFARAARVVEAEYEWPFQSHACMGPACAVADVRDDRVTVWTGSQKPHFVRDGVAAQLGRPLDAVRAIWVPGPGSYGRNDAGDAAHDAAFLSKAVGRPVRVQGMRHEGHGWDPKGPASIHRARAALDAQGNVVAYHFESKGFSRIDIDTNESNPAYSLSGQLMDVPLKSLQGFGVPAEAYGFANKRLAWETILPLLDRASPLRTAHLRDPVGPQIHFASESFIDELAAATGTDPVELRLRYIKDARDAAVIKAAAERAGWQPRAARTDQSQADVLRGRGMAYVRRAGTIVAVVANVEIERRTGKIWPRGFVVAHDCGLIVNPDGLRRCIEGNIVQMVSRSLWEEVGFARDKVTSVDWASYPILDIADTPETVDIVLINRPDIPPAGAGEPATRPVAAAIANAIFDATGVRLRRVPFTPDRVRALFA
jgi:nicotinate dehydrogenase subunit B